MILLSTIASQFNTDKAFIEDAILLMQYIVADVREAPNGMIVSRDNTGMSVSYQAYKWAIGFNVRITDADQITRMESAIEKNINVLQPMIDDYEAICSEINVWMFYGAEKIRNSYKNKIDSGAIAEDTTYEAYKETIMGPLREDHDIAKNRIYLGECNLHPNKHLQSLGLKFIRFESITPLYRD